MMRTDGGVVAAVCLSASYAFSKRPVPEVRLIAGHGIEGDVHAGAKVRHRSRVARNPEAANLRQVHLLHSELLEELRGRGYALRPGDIGENILTQGIALLDLPTGTRLHLGPDAIVEVTGLRNPCAQLDTHQAGLMSAVIERDAENRLVRKAGIMAIVASDGLVRPGDTIVIVRPEGQPRPLAPV